MGGGHLHADGTVLSADGCPGEVGSAETSKSWPVGDGSLALSYPQKSWHHPRPASVFQKSKNVSLASTD